MKKIRDSKIELMRIMCMLFLVMHHFILHGDILTNISPNTFIYNIFVIFYPIGKICYDIFIVISCYYMINTQFSGMRFINIWLEVFFYNIIIDFFVIAIEGYKGYSSLRMLLGGLFPMLGNSHGFASAYLFFLLILPFVKIVEEKLSKIQIFAFTFILLMLQIGTWIINTLCGFDSRLRSELFVFFIIYNILYLYRKFYENKLSHKTANYLLLFTFILFIFEYFIWRNYLINANSLCSKLLIFINNQNSPLNIFISFTIVIYIMKFGKSFSNRIINKIASCTFGILLIHDHNYFRNILWNKLVPTYTVYLHNGIIYFMIISIILFFICIIVDMIRQKFITNNLIKLKPINSFAETLNKLLYI